MNDHAELAQRFIESFEVVAVNLEFFEDLEPTAALLATGPADDYGHRRWKPMNAENDPSALEPLYEQLVLSHRWADVDLQTFTLLANPPSEGLSGLLQRIMKDKGLWETLISNGYLQFGKGPDMDCDPVCFDISSRKNRDYRIVKIDHEDILCNSRIKVVAEIAPSFRALVLQTIERAAAVRKS
jgi:hypothetical protein